MDLVLVLKYYKSELGRDWRETEPIYVLIYDVPFSVLSQFHTT